ncbi:MAG: hypothetical protein AVDCRST_MAG93-3938 [uncultured Chloroflexia bacterium]|uniref:Uncharacterized protein n=1 Tax=uncultured Chloroflexia bacterium TaxID=1672391 RepID=A0A6J4JZD6_9CHLR|nr:MAG: hypothetical protein AVDCRST_MAG93-3938 [uncultured Chloroflexia bacterium]
MAILALLTLGSLEGWSVLDTQGRFGEVLDRLEQERQRFDEDLRRFTLATSYLRALLPDPSQSHAPPLVPQSSDAQRLGVEERHIAAVAARDPHDPCAFAKVCVTRFQECLDVGSLGEFPAVVSTSRALDNRLRAHPPL